MARIETGEPRRSVLENVPFRSAAARLLRPASAFPAERRHLEARHGLRHRIQQEFAEMPGLSLTLAQAARLFGLANDACARIFGELIEEGFLNQRRTDQCRYGRTNGELSLMASRRKLAESMNGVPRARRRA